MRLHRYALARASAATLLVACGVLGSACGDDAANPCTPGRVVECPCVGGGAGVQTCLDDGTYGACDCGGTPDAGIDAGSADAAPSDGSPEADASAGGDAQVTPVTCDSPDDCEAPADCVGSGCVDPVPDPAVYAEAAGSRRASYVWTIQFPGFLPDSEPCCFDLDGDATLDNAFGDLMSLMASYLTPEQHPQLVLDTALAAGQAVRVIDWVVLPEGADGLARLSLFPGAQNGDGTGGLLPWEDYVSGQGHVLLDPEGFGSHGALDQINAATVVGARLTGAGGPVTLPLPGFLGAGLQPIPIRQVRVEMDLAIDVGSCAGVCSEDALLGDPEVLVAGLRLGGLIHQDDFLGGLDASLRTCACAGVDPTEPVLQWSIEGGTGELAIECNPENTPDDGSLCSELDDPICASGSSTCSYLAMLPEMFDLDTDGNGVADALSIGLRLGLSGATIDGLVP